MATVRSLGRPSKAEFALLERGRAAFAVLFPNQEFASSSWNMRHLKKSGAGQGNVNLSFTRIDKVSRDEVLPDRFANMLKAHCCVSGIQAGTMYNHCNAARWFWEAIRIRIEGNRDAFDWRGVNKEDAERAEELMLESGMDASSAYRRCRELSSFLNTLAAAGVIVPVAPSFQSDRRESFDRITLEGREARESLLPSEEAIAGLSEVFNRAGELDEFDQLLACIPALMFSDGQRVIENLQLSTNPLRKEGKRTFLYYFKAKGKRVIEEKMPLTPLQAELAGEAIRRALKLTYRARSRAKELVASPHRFPLPKWAEAKVWLSTAEVLRLLGVTSDPGLSSLVSYKKAKQGNGYLYDRESLREYLQEVRKKVSLESIRGVTRREDGTWLPLDQALFISFRHAGHEEKATSQLFVSMVTQQKVGTFLGGHANGLKSIFERLDIRERDGQFISLNSHQIRHYVTSKASGAGISDVHLVRWQRRAHVGDLEAYKHLTSEERLKRLREHVRGGRLKGDLASMYFALAPDEREVFLETTVQAIHVTHLGFCVHDFNTSPCPSAMNCVKRCGKFLYDPDDQVQRKRLVELKSRNAKALKDAEKAQASGKGMLAEEWVRELKATEEGISIILETKSGGGGAGLIAPFPDDPSKFKG